MNVHDSEIIGYEVNLKNNLIKFQIKQKLFGETRYREINFINVLAHYFETVLPCSIIFDITSVNINEFISDNEVLLEMNKKYCWPIVYNNTDELISLLKSKKYNYYRIESSFGLSGWIIAEEIKMK